MPCTASFSIGFPLGGAVQVICVGGVGTLSSTYGSVTSNCRPSRVRGRINGGAWVYTNVFPGGSPPYYAPWTIRDIPGATCNNLPDTLQIEVEVTDSVTGTVSWIAANPVTFSAYCNMAPPPMRMQAAEMMEVEVAMQELLPPSLLWGVIAGKLAETKIVKLRRARHNAEGVVWQSIGTAEGLWTLTAGGDNKAQLVLTLDVLIEDEPYALEFPWASGDFSAVEGGLFGPVGSNTIIQTLNVRGRKNQGPSLKARPRAKGRAKARGKPVRKAARKKRGAKKRRGRR